MKNQLVFIYLFKKNDKNTRITLEHILSLGKKLAVKILIIDDEELDLFINKKLLGLEYETEGFSSIQEAVQWAGSNDFDIALIDYYLGHNIYAHNALEKLIEVKGKSFEAFVLSNFVDQKQSEDLIKAGFKDIIYKPLTVEMFKSVLNLA